MAPSGPSGTDHRPLTTDHFSFAFSLMELIVVIAIAGLLFAAAMPTISQTWRASRLTSAGQTVVDTLSLARQTAISRNTPVEVRFYKLPDHNAPPSASPTIYRGLQAFLLQTERTVPLGKAEFLPSPVLISTGAKESPFLNSARHPEEAASPGVPVGDAGANYVYRALRFTPGGSVDLTTGDNCLTLILQNDRPLAEGVNFYAVQIDPINGSVRTFQP